MAEPDYEYGALVTGADRGIGLAVCCQLGRRYGWTFVHAPNGWKVSEVVMTAVWEDGNRGPMAQAAAWVAG